MNDQNKKQRLIEEIQRLQAAGAREILLSLAQYFDGNGEPWCNICANNIRPVSAEQMLTRLRQIEARSEVHSVWVRFYEYADALEDADLWVGSDSLYVVTRAEAATVRAWFADLEVTDVAEEDDLAGFAGLPPLPAGFRLVRVWWD